MDYPTLIASKSTPGSIAAWVNYSKLDAVTIVAEAQAEIFSRLRCREMRTLDTSITTAAGGLNYALPANFLDPIDPLIDNQGNVYVHKTEGEILRRRSFDGSGNVVQGVPEFWSIFDEMIQFETAFDTAGWTLQLLCFKSPAPLSSSNTTNFLTNRYPHLLRRACMMQAADFQEDGEEYQKHLIKLEAVIETINAENDLHYRGVVADGMTNNYVSY